MNKRQNLLRLAGTAVITCLMAGAVASTVVSALGLGANTLGAYLGALVAGLVAALCAFSTWTAILSVAGATVGVGAWVAAGLSEGGAVRALAEGFKAAYSGGNAVALLENAGVIAVALAAVMSLIYFVFLTERGPVTTILATGVTLGTAVVCAAVSSTVALVQLVPAIVGSAAAIAHSAEQRRTGGHLKALIPALIAVGIAFALVPAAGFTFAPLEDAATKVRQLYEDYFNYTEERVAFSINEQGYDYYAMKDDTPTHLLGGPANPDDQPVMRVTTDSDLLLRGTVRGTYTGYSWEDTTAKARNLYYDFTRLSRRKAVFGTDLLAGLDGAYSEVKAQIEMLKDGSSTIFVPARLTDFDMALQSAVYYNTVGEMFLARSVETGDTYAFTAEEVTDYAALSALAAARAEKSDSLYEDAQEDYIALPDGIEEGVFKIADALTEGLTTDAEKAQAILEGLKAGCKYTMDVPYPPADRDFVSYFLIDSREGYCSYFATAMAVLCRIEGIPARYVEGYRVYADPSGVTMVTGESAHAWVEVYLKGVGWVAYDPTPGRDDSQSTGENAQTNPTPSPTPEATPEPSDGPDTGLESTPTPNPSDLPSALPSTEPTSQPTDNPDPTPETHQKFGRWLWILLIALLVLMILALLFLWIRRRLEVTDPVRMVAKQQDFDRAIIVMYRALLTLLSQLGQTPLSGETPEAFASRVTRSGMANPDFVEFAKGVTVARYSRNRATRELVSLGSRAYVRFRQQMKKTERFRFDAHRVLRGLGDFTQIP
jgi:hypothetical protein